MTGKELIFSTLKLNKCKRAPWVPFVGVHGAFLTGYNSESYLKSKELIVKGVSAAIQEYKPDGIPVVFDLQLEAEALGCGVIWANENPPSVIGHPLADGISLSDLTIPGSRDGRIGLVMDAVKELRDKYPDIALYGLVTGPFTLGLHLLGTEIFMQMFTDEYAVHNLMRFCTDTAKAMSRYYSEAGCDIIAIVDPMTSQIGTEQFESFVSEYMKEIFDYVRRLNKYSSFFVCGDAQHNIEAMCNCLPDNVSIDENIPLDYVRDVCLSKGISFGGNLKLTSTLLLGNIDDSIGDALDCLEKGGEKGFILAPGCDLPYRTVVENLKAVSDIAVDSYKREVARILHSGSTIKDSESREGENFKPDEPKKADNNKDQLSDKGKLTPERYKNSSKVKIDVITLDSASCAPCQYMMSAVSRASEQFGERVEVEEFKIKESKGLEMMSLLNVKKIPTICIDGEVCFSSNIPPVDVLKNEIESRLSNKETK